MRSPAGIRVTHIENLSVAAATLSSQPRRSIVTQRWHQGDVGPRALGAVCALAAIGNGTGLEINSTAPSFEGVATDMVAALSRPSEIARDFETRSRTSTPDTPARRAIDINVSNAIYEAIRG